MFKKAFVAVVAALFMANVQANTVGLYLGGQIWQSEFSGGVGKESELIDFNYKKEQQTSFFVAFEHPFPLVPNLRISHTNFDTISRTNSMEEFSFPEGTTVHEALIDTDVESRFNISYVDYTLYYQLLDSRSFSLDLGITARDFSGAITVTEDITTVNNWDDIFGNPYTATRDDKFTNEIKTNDIEPMLYIASNIGLPLKGMSVFAQGEFLLKGDRTISDYQVGIIYDLIDSHMVDFNVIFGYRTVRMEFKSSDDLFSDPEIKGGFISIIAHF